MGLLDHQSSSLGPRYESTNEIRFSAFIIMSVMTRLAKTERMGRLCPRSCSWLLLLPDHLSYLRGRA